MTFRRVVSALAVCGALLAAPHAQQPSQPMFRSATQVVPLYVTVTDATGRLVAGLTRDDFTILDNGVAQQIAVFENESVPFSASLMIDTSLSMTLNLDLVKQGAEQFLMRLEPTDEAMVGAFNDKIQFACDLTSDRETLIGSLDDLGFGNPTRLYDSVDQSIEELRRSVNRKVVVVFTDGEDTASKASLGRVIERSRTEEVMVYAVGIRSRMVVGTQRIETRPDRGLKRLAEETGGGFYELKGTDELGPTFTKVAQELRSQYVLGFSPAVLDGKVHKLEVRLSQPTLQARARKTYLAAPAK
ncbi:MAG: VWA domain-containing protein [Acidobacteria bacterium]|jgi:Ca-activated chloride channel family protein|nr:VWA domain-containing protein [Acidobacteriota bacterium]